MTINPVDPKLILSFFDQKFDDEKAAKKVRRLVERRLAQDRGGTGFGTLVHTLGAYSVAIKSNDDLMIYAATGASQSVETQLARVNGYVPLIGDEEWILGRLLDYVAFREEEEE